MEMMGLFGIFRRKKVFKVRIFRNYGGDRIFIQYSYGYRDKWVDIRRYIGAYGNFTEASGMGEWVPVSFYREAEAEAFAKRFRSYDDILEYYSTFDGAVLRDEERVSNYYKRRGEINKEI